jgi:hypothetical protein
VKITWLMDVVDVTIVTPSHMPVYGEFTQGMALLPAYPRDELGGPERVIDIAIGLGRHEDKEDGLPAILLQLPSATAAEGLGTDLEIPSGVASVIRMQWILAPPTESALTSPPRPESELHRRAHQVFEAMREDADTLPPRCQRPVQTGPPELPRYGEKVIPRAPSTHPNIHHTERD